MAFARLTISLLLFQLSLLSSITVYGSTATPPSEAPKPPPHRHHHHHPPAPTPSPVYPPIKPPAHRPVKPPVHPPVKPPVHPPVKPPVKPPSHPPVKQPVKPPVKPPSHPPVKPPVYPPKRKMVAIRGVVFCKACKYRGVDTLEAATPLSGAVVQLKCKNTKYSIVEKKTTDKKGFFTFTPKTVTTFGVHKCNVTLVSSHLGNCSHPTNLNGGVGGATPFPTPLPPVNHKPPPFVLYSLQPFAFEPSKKFPCRK